MTLEDYRKENDLSYENLARFLEMTTSKTYRLCNEPNSIRLVDANSIVVKTNKAVTIEDLLPEGSNDGTDISTNG